MPAGLNDRLAAIGLDAADAAVMRDLGPVLRPHRDAFIDDLYGHLQRFEMTAALLGSGEVVARLKRSQRAYFDSLFTGTFDRAYAEGRSRMGAVHHRVHLAPRWFLGTYALYLTAQLPVLFRDADRKTVARRVAALSRTLFLDAGIALDAYGRAEAVELKGVATTAAESGAAPERRHGHGGSAAEIRAHAPALLLTSADVGVRRAFVGLGVEEERVIRDHGALLREAAALGVARFYERVPRDPAWSRFFEDDAAVDRLRELQIDFWGELSEGRFDRPYASTRIRVGVVHERIGVTPSTYLAGVCVVLMPMLEHLIVAAGVGLEVIGALVRAVFFDISFVIDAYAAARRDALLDSGRYARQLVTRMRSGVLVVNGRLEVESANQALLDMFGLDGGVLLHMPVEHALPFAGVRELLASSLRDDEPPGSHVIDAQGGKRIFRLSPVPLHPGSGPSERVALVVDDLTELAQLGKSAQQAETRYRDIVRDASSLVWEMDLDSGMLEMVSHHVRRLTGLPPTHFLGRPGAWREQLWPADRAAFDRALARARETRGRIDLEHRLSGPHGKPVWVHTSARVAPVDGDLKLRGVTSDLSDRERARLVLEEQLRRERLLGQLARDIVALGEPGETAERVCRVAAELVGARQTILLQRQGAQAGAIVARFPPTTGDEDLVRASAMDRLEAAPAVTTVAALAAIEGILQLSGEGSASVVVASVADSRTPTAVLVAVAGEGEPLDEVDASGLDTAAALFALALRRRIAEEEALHSQKLRALGTLAGGMAHDFNNVLAIVMVRSEQIRDAMTAAGLDAKAAEDVLANVEQGASIIRRILDFAGPSVSGRAHVSLGEAVERSVELLRPLAPASVTLEVKSDRGVHARVDVAQVDQILTNLVTNALHAMKDSGTLRIEVSTARTEGPLAVAGGALPPGDYAHISVEDTGPGFTPEALSRGLDPFFSTKREGEGSGLGLSVVLGLVGANDGWLALSNTGSGAKVDLYFPLLDVPERPPVRPGPDHPADEVAAAGPRVLFVEDKGLLRAVLAQSLADVGFEVVSATDAEAAMRILSDAEHVPDVVLTDMVMPGKSGRDLAQWIKVHRPGIPVVLLTGSMRASAVGGEDFDAVINKPVGTDRLAGVLREVVARARCR